MFWCVYRVVRVEVSGSKSFIYTYSTYMKCIIPNIVVETLKTGAIQITQNDNNNRYRQRFVDFFSLPMVHVIITR